MECDEEKEDGISGRDGTIGVWKMRLTELTKQRFPRLTRPLAVVSITGPPSPGAAPTLSSCASEDGLTFLPAPPAGLALVAPFTKFGADGGGAEPGGGLSRAAHETGAFLTGGGAGAAGAGGAGSSDPVAGASSAGLEVEGEEGDGTEVDTETGAAEDTEGEGTADEVGSGVSAGAAGGGGSAEGGEDGAATGAVGRVSAPEVGGDKVDVESVGSSSTGVGSVVSSALNEIGGSSSCEVSFSLPIGLSLDRSAIPNVSVSTGFDWGRDCFCTGLEGLSSCQRVKDCLMASGRAMEDRKVTPGAVDELDGRDRASRRGELYDGEG